MKLIWPGVLLGTGAVGTAGGLYGNSLYLKSVSRQEANIKFEEIRSEIEEFVKDFGNDESFKDNILTALVSLWMSWLELKNNDVEKFKKSLENDLEANKEKKETLKNLYKNVEDFVKFLNDSGIDISEYQTKIVNISIPSEEETLSHN